MFHFADNTKAHCHRHSHFLHLYVPLIYFANNTKDKLYYNRDFQFYSPCIFHLHFETKSRELLNICLFALAESNHKVRVWSTGLQISVSWCFVFALWHQFQYQSNNSLVFPCSHVWQAKTQGLVVLCECIDSICHQVTHKQRFWHKLGVSLTWGYKKQPSWLTLLRCYILWWNKNEKCEMEDIVVSIVLCRKFTFVYAWRTIELKTHRVALLVDWDNKLTTQFRLSRQREPWLSKWIPAVLCDTKIGYYEQGVDLWWLSFYTSLKLCVFFCRHINNYFAVRNIKSWWLSPTYTYKHCHLDVATFLLCYCNAC